jgi:alanine racemase
MNALTTWIELSKEALTHNIAHYKQVVGPTVCLAAVVKSNAYGHGVQPLACLLESNPQIDWLCTVNLSEALTLRIYGITKPILVLSYLDVDYTATKDLIQAIELDISMVVYDEHTLLRLHQAAQQTSKVAKIHLKVDTGLSRVGQLPEQAFVLAQQAYMLSNVMLEGIFTHFSDSESADHQFVYIQLALFEDLINTLEDKGIHIPVKHSSCSAAITISPKTHFNFVRIGIGMYGIWPSSENRLITQHHAPWFSLKPILTWKTRLKQIKTVSADTWVGYDRTYKTTRPTRLGLLPIGYYEGYNRLLSNQGKVLIHNILAPVLGRVTMNLITIDLTDCPQAAIEDEVTLIGPEKPITAECLAAQSNTIAYEIVAKLNPIITRIISD